MMSDGPIESPLHHSSISIHDLVIGNDGFTYQWRHSWLSIVLFLGVYFNLVPVIATNKTPYLDVAAIIAQDLASGQGQHIGKIVCFRKEEKSL